MIVLEDETVVTDVPVRAPEGIGSVARREVVRDGETIHCVAVKVRHDKWDVIDTAGEYSYSLGNNHIEEGYWTILHRV